MALLRLYRERVAQRLQPQEFAEPHPASTFGATILATIRRVDAA